MPETFPIESSLIRQGHVAMKRSLWITIALTTVIVAVTGVILWRRFNKQTQFLAQTVAPVRAENVSFRFSECAGKRSVFVLDNQTTQPIYARVQRVDYWPEYRDTNMQYGVHIVKYQALNAADFVDRSDRFDAPIPFTTVLPYSNIRYGVDLREQTGLYKIMVPYIETKDIDLVNRMNEGIQALTEDDFKRLETAWKAAWSETAANRCK
jgi:hypothetical protein